MCNVFHICFVDFFPSYNPASVILKSTWLRSEVSQGHFLLTFPQRNALCSHGGDGEGVPRWLAFWMFIMWRFPRMSLEECRACEASAPPVPFFYHLALFEMVLGEGLGIRVLLKTFSFPYELANKTIAGVCLIKPWMWKERIHRRNTELVTVRTPVALACWRAWA